MHWKSSKAVRQVVRIGAVCLVVGACCVMMVTLREKESRLSYQPKSRNAEPNSGVRLESNETNQGDGRDSGGGRWRVRPSVAGPAKGEAGDRFVHADPCEIRALIETDGRKRIYYSRVKEIVTRQEIPRLQDMLADKNYAAYWPNIATLIGMVSSDVNSVPILIDYIRRPDTGDLSRFMVTRKIYSLRYLGKIGGEAAKVILKSAVTAAGAEDLAGAWIESERVGPKEETIDAIQYAAIQGLVFLREPEVNVFIETLYMDEVQKAKENKRFTPFSGTVMDAMAMRDYIQDTGDDLDAYFMKESEGGLFDKFAPYFRKYSPKGICPTTG